MIFPTIEDKKTLKTHAVKDLNHCECGVKYNFFYTITKKDLKNIHFKQINEITCPDCKSIIQ